MDPDAPVLVGCSHGTRSPAGRRTIALLRLAVGAQRPGLEVVAAHVDVQRPALDDVVDRLAAAGRRCVVVPLLLSTGHHVRHDVAVAVRRSRGLAVAAAALGPRRCSPTSSPTGWPRPRPASTSAPASSSR